MLYLGEGSREVPVSDDRAMLVFPDFSDPGQFHYLPGFPRLALLEDGSPAFRLIVFREDLDEVEEDAEDAVGMLSLDVDLRWDPADVEEAARRIRMQDGLEQEPRLTPILFRSGTVRLMLLSSISSVDEDEDEEPTDFVATVLGAGTPSLYGDNRAIFQARLPKKGVSALAGSLDGMLPIGVVYSLTFAGLQPAFRVEAHVDWTKIHEHFSTRENTNVLFYEKDVREVLDTFEDERVIDVDVTVEGIGAEGMETEREAVLKIIRQHVVDTFFEATLEPLDPAGGGTAGAITDTLRTIGQDGLTLGMGYTYLQKHVTLEEARSLDIDWSARRAAERTIYPQAHLHALIGERGLTIEDLRTVVDPDQLFEQVPLEIVVHSAWEADGIVGVTVDAGYQDPATGTSRMFTESFDKDHTSVERRDWADRTNGTDFWYRYQVVFLDSQVPGPTLTVRSDTPEEPWRHHTGGTVVTITPQELYDIRAVEVMTVADFPFDRWPAVKVSVRHEADDGSFRYQSDEVLTAQTMTFAPRFRTDKTVPGVTSIKREYEGASGERVELPWTPVEDTVVVVTDPHGEDLEVRVLVSDSRENLANLLVTLRYDDPENGVHEDATMSFTPETVDAAQTWTVHLADPTRRRFAYQATLVTTSGQVIQTGWIETTTDVVPIGEQTLKTMRVEIVAEELAEGVQRVDVALRYEDAENSVLEEKEVTLHPGTSDVWELRLADATRRSYQITTTWVTTTGFRTTHGPLTTSGSRVVIPPAPPGDD